MDQAQSQEVWEFLQKSRSILVVLPEVLNIDIVAAAIGFKHALLASGKEVEIASTGNILGISQLLPEASTMSRQLPSSKTLVVLLDTSQTPLEEMSYHTEGLVTKIFLTPKDGEFTPEQISFSKSVSRFDSIVSIGAGQIEDFGKLFSDNSDLFYETPKVNIDTAPQNTFFGALNLVDVTSTSVSELVTDIVLQNAPASLTEPVATALLAGIIAQTNSFQLVHTTPKAFLLASELVQKGARQQDIIRYLFKTRPLPLLQLWGRALARLKTIGEQEVLYSVLSQVDFSKTQTDTTETLNVLHELLDNISGYKFLAVIVETPEKQTRIFAAAHPTVSIESLALRLASVVDGATHKHGLYTVGQIALQLPFDQAESVFVSAVEPQE